MDSVLQDFHDDLKALRRALKAETTLRVAKRSFRDEAERLGKRWFYHLNPGSLSKPAISGKGCPLSRHLPFDDFHIFLIQRKGKG